MAKKKATTRTVTLTVHELHRLLAPVVPLACPDATLPAINAVHLLTVGDYLTAAATDRFRAGIQRVRPQAGAPGPIDALVNLDDIKRLLRVFKPVRGQDPADVHLTVDDTVVWAESAGGLGFTLAELKVGARIVPDEFPNIGSLLQRRIGAHVEDAGSAVGVNPDYLASFKAAAKAAQESGIILAPPPAGSKEPLLVHVGDDFIGLLMPRRPHGVEREQLVSTLAARWTVELDKIAKADTRRAKAAAARSKKVLDEQNKRMAAAAARKAALAS